MVPSQPNRLKFFTHSTRGYEGTGVGRLVGGGGQYLRGHCHSPSCFSQTYSTTYKRNDVFNLNRFLQNEYPPSTSANSPFLMQRSLEGRDYHGVVCPCERGTEPSNLPIHYDVQSSSAYTPSQNVSFTSVLESVVIIVNGPRSY